MKDTLKNFIQQHRSEFDDKQPSPSNWLQIDRALFNRQAWLQPIRYWQAAAILFCALTIYSWNSNSPLMRSEVKSNSEFSDTEAFYIEQISEKLNLIKSIKQSDLSGFTHDFQQLEAMYMVLKEETKHHSSEKVREAMILNLLVRINLLNQQLYELDKPAKPETISS